MTHWKSVEQAIEFAIGEEQAAAEFYTRLANESRLPGMRDLLLGFAQEEAKHKAKLQALKAGGTLGAQPATDLRIADYVVEVEAGPYLDFRGALVLAMKKEKAAFRLYSDLADSAGHAQVKAMFAAMAQEEARHKLRFEVEYDDMLVEN